MSSSRVSFVLSAPPCSLPGHDHVLDVVSDHVQDGTGARAVVAQCPAGRARWFLVEGRAPSALNEMMPAPVVDGSFSRSPRATR